MIAGVAVDQWKLKTYKKEIEKEGFEIKETIPDKGAGYALMQVYCVDAIEINKLTVLLKKLERKYSQRNKMN